jgi:hypothetical protein
LAVALSDTERSELSNNSERDAAVGRSLADVRTRADPRLTEAMQ